MQGNYIIILYSKEKKIHINLKKFVSIIKEQNIFVVKYFLVIVKFDKSSFLLQFT